MFVYREFEGIADTITITNDALLQFNSDVEQNGTVANETWWQAVEPMQIRRFSLATAAVTTTHGYDVYALGGQPTDAGQENETEWETFERYSNGTWEILERMPTGRIDLAAAAVFITEVVPVNGSQPTNETNTNISHFAIYAIGGTPFGDSACSGTRIVERYDTYSKNWTAVTSMNSSRSAFSATTIRHTDDDQWYIYVAGGWSDGCGSQLLTTAERYSVEDDTWTVITSMTTARKWFAMTSVTTGSGTQLLFVVGGLVRSRNIPFLSVVAER